jgi:hypothetical protein
LAGLVVLAGLEASVASGAWVGLVVLAGLEAWMAWVEEIECPLCRVGVATSGNTIPSIAAGLPTKTGLLRTALAARRVAIRSPSDRPTRGNRSVAKVAIWPAPVAESLSAIGVGEAVSAIGAEPVRVVGLAEVEPTVSEAVTFRAAVVATAMPSEAVPVDTADRALVAAAAAAHPVLDLEAAEAALAVAADAAGKWLNGAEIVGART